MILIFEVASFHSEDSRVKINGSYSNEKALNLRRTHITPISRSYNTMDGYIPAIASMGNQSGNDSLGCCIVSARRTLNPAFDLRYVPERHSHCSDPNVGLCTLIGTVIALA